MTKKEFRNLVSQFLQDPSAIEDVGELVSFANCDMKYLLSLKQSDGEIVSVSDEFLQDVSPMDWLAKRLAHLDVLAKSILKIAEDKVSRYELIPVEASFGAPGEGAEQVDLPDATKSLYEKLSSPSSFETSVYYLTADAGEGKSVVMWQLAKCAAQNYIANKQNWLFVPIELGGRPYMRLDEIILGTLAKAFRYTHCYLESFFQLLRRGRIVLGLDGFEESFVQGADGDVVSCLASLLKSMDSQGQLVFSSRTAYYAHSRMRAQSQYSEVFKDFDISFYEMRLKRWGKVQFTNLLMRYEFAPDEAEKVYSRLQGALSANSPMLCRAVLAHKLIRELRDMRDLREDRDVESLVEALDSKSQICVVHSFVRFLLEREARKLIRRDVDGTPVLEAQDHELLLSMLAEEMWRVDSEALAMETVNTCVDVLCEKKMIAPQDVIRCKQHLCHHAMLQIDSDGSLLFCHEEFYMYFLGVFLFNELQSADTSARRKLLDRKIFPEPTLDEFARRVLAKGSGARLSVRLLEDSRNILRTSLISQNIAAALLLLHRDNHAFLEISGLYCPAFAMKRTCLQGVKFRRCLFDSFDFENVAGAKCEFSDCETAVAECKGTTSFCDIMFDESSLPHILRVHLDDGYSDIGDPGRVCAFIQNRGGVVHNSVLSQAESGVAKEDSRIATFFKVVHVFETKTYVTENLLRKFLGTRYSLFERELRAQMLKLNVLSLRSYKGKSDQEMFRLEMELPVLFGKRALCNGDYDTFLKLLKG